MGLKNRGIKIIQNNKMVGGRDVINCTYNASRATAEFPSKVTAVYSLSLSESYTATDCCCDFFLAYECLACFFFFVYFTNLNPPFFLFVRFPNFSIIINCPVRFQIIVREKNVIITRASKYFSPHKLIGYKTLWRLTVD